MKITKYFTVILLLCLAFIFLYSITVMGYESKPTQKSIIGDQAISRLDVPSKILKTEEVTQTFSLQPSGWLSPEIRISDILIDKDQEDPAIAYNPHHHEFMVAWYNNRPNTQDITVQRVDDQGKLWSYFFVSTAENCRYPDLAYSLTNGEYLVVWSQYHDVDDRWEIWGRIIDWDETGPNTPFKIASWGTLNLLYPRVAYNSYRNQYLVVWKTSMVSSGQLTGIGRKVLNGSGGTVTGEGYITGEEPMNEGSPDVDYNLAGDNYLVTWVDLGPQGYPNIYGGILEDDGDLSGSVFPIADDIAGYQQQRPAVTTNHGDGFMVNWDLEVGSDWDVYGRKIFTNGSIDPWYWLIAIDEEIDERNPAISARNPSTGYLTVHEKDTSSGISIIGHRWGLPSSYRMAEIAPGAMGDNTDPAVAAGRPCYLIAYEWESWTPTEDKDIYGRLWCPDALFLPLISR